VEGVLGKDPYSNAKGLISLDRLGRMASTLGAISGVQRTNFAVEILMQWINVASIISVMVFRVPNLSTKN
jgi:hypothetical protein